MTYRSIPFPWLSSICDGARGIRQPAPPFGWDERCLRATHSTSTPAKASGAKNARSAIRGSRTVIVGPSPNESEDHHAAEFTRRQALHDALQGLRSGAIFEGHAQTHARRPADARALEHFDRLPACAQDCFARLQDVAFLDGQS